MKNEMWWSAGSAEQAADATVVCAQVEVSRIEEERSMEMPVVAPECSGRPYRYAYALSSRVAGRHHWGAPQVHITGQELRVFTCVFEAQQERHGCLKIIRTCVQCLRCFTCICDQDITKVTLPLEQSKERHQSTGESGSESSAKVERWSPGRDSFAQEPVFVPRLGSCKGQDRNSGNAARREDDGWLLAPVLRSATMTTDLVILDAADLAAGPVATIHLPLHIPIGTPA